MTRLQVRPAQPGDLGALVRIWWAMQVQHRGFDSAFYADLGEELCCRECRHYFAAQLDDPTARFLVAQADGELVGLLLAQFRTRPPIFCCRRHLVIELAAVVPGWRRRGVFTRLLDEARRLAGEDGVRLLQLNVDAANDAALEAYARRGFAPRQMMLVQWLDKPGESP